MLSQPLCCPRSLCPSPHWCQGARTLLITMALHPHTHSAPATAFPLGNHPKSTPNLPPGFPSAPCSISHPQTTLTAPQPTFAPLPCHWGDVSKAAPSPCSQSRARYSPKANPKDRSWLQLYWPCRGADGMTIEQPEGKLILQPKKDLRLVGKLQMKAEVPPPLHWMGSDWGGSVGGDGNFTALRGRLMKSCCCSPLRAQLREAAFSLSSSVCGEAGGQTRGVPGPSSPTAGQAKRGAETLPLPRTGSSFAKLHCQKDAL